MPDPNSLPAKWEIFKHSYDEVLEGLKHQDEKLGRTLTALAFLTAAAVSLFTRFGRGPGAKLTFPEGGPSITAVLFVTFLVAVALALVTALVAIGPGRALRFQARPRDPSLLYYSSIAEVSEVEWDKRFTDHDQDGAERLAGELARDFHTEARGIAQRVAYKVARSREAAAYVQLAVVALALLGIFETRGFSPLTRWWLAAGLVGVFLLVPFWELARMKHDKYAKVSFNCAYAALVGAVVLAILFLVLAESNDEHWPALGYGLAVLWLSRLAIVGPTVAIWALGVAIVLALVPFLAFVDVL